MPFQINITDVEIEFIIRKSGAGISGEATVTLIDTNGKRYQDDAFTPTLSAAQRTAQRAILDDVIAQAKARRGI